MPRTGRTPFLPAELPSRGGIDVIRPREKTALTAEDLAIRLERPRRSPMWMMLDIIRTAGDRRDADIMFGLMRPASSRYCFGCPVGPFGDCRRRHPGPAGCFRAVGIAVPLKTFRRRS